MASCLLCGACGRDVLELELCGHAACSACLRRWVAGAMPECEARRQVRVPCFAPACRKAMPQHTALALSQRARAAADAIDQDQDIPQARRCVGCGQDRHLVVHAPCSHEACEDCWAGWAARELAACRAEHRRHARCCRPGCQELVDPGFWRAALAWCVAAQDCAQHAEAADSKLRMMRTKLSVFAAARHGEAGPKCPVCRERCLALLGDGHDPWHMACERCWVRWAEEQLDSGGAKGLVEQVPCLWPQCGSAASEHLWQHAVGHSQRLQPLAGTLTHRRELRRNPFYPVATQVDCPQPGCLGLGYLGFDTVMCFICEHQWVPGEGAGEPPPEVDAEQLMGVSVKRCPQCHKYIEKNGGCDHMTCRCRHEFWWTTLKPYRR